MNPFKIRCNTHKIDLFIAVTLVILVVGFTRSVAIAKIYIGDCNYDADPENGVGYSDICLKSTLSSTFEQRSAIEDDMQPPTLLDAKFEGTSLLSDWGVMQLAGHSRMWKIRYTNRASELDSKIDRALFQLGNSATARHRISGGLSKKPFGLNMNLDDAWYGFDVEEQFFGDRMAVASYTYDNRKDFSLSLSIEVGDNTTDEPNRRHLGGTARAAYDFAALEGTRALVSFSNTELSERSFGIALLNMNGKGDRSTVEWVRKWKFFAFDPVDFEQLIRVNWKGAFQYSWSPGIQYEDIWGKSRRGSLSGDYQLDKHAVLMVTLGFQRSEAKFSETPRLKNFSFVAGGFKVIL
jgi:hypothetical protein